MYEYLLRMALVKQEPTDESDARLIALCIQFVCAEEGAPVGVGCQDAGCGFRDHRLGLELPAFGGNPEVPVHGCGGATVGGLGALLPLADKIPNHTDRSTFVPLDNLLC